MNSVEAMRSLRVEFPELEVELDTPDWTGLLHLEIGCLTRYTQQAVDNGERALVGKCFEFARRLSVTGDSDIQNAIGVSFVGHLNFKDGEVQRIWAYEVLPQSLREIAIELGNTPPIDR